MMQQLTTYSTDYLASSQLTVDKEAASRSLVSNYIENYANNSYPPSALREFINSHVNMPGFEEICEDGALASSGTIRNTEQELTFKVIDRVQGTTLLSQGDHHFIVDNQLWQNHSADERNNDKDAQKHQHNGQTGQNYKNIGLLRRLLKSSS